MPASNRTRHSDDFGGSSAVRTLGAFLLCATVSFALGFFVLARFWSNKPHPDGEPAEKSAVAAADTHTVAPRSDESPTAMRSTLPTPRPAPRIVPPRIDPVDEGVQKPSSPDDTKDARKPADGSADSLPDASAAAKPVVTPAAPGDSAADPAAPATDPTPARRRRRHRADVAKATPDPEMAPPSSTDDVNDARASRTPVPAKVEGDAAPSSGLYRVQIGVYSTREKAEEQAKSASDKGFDTTIHTVANGERTLYRVQHSAHHTRAGAEAEKQRLVDAGFDAYISNP